MALTAMGLSVGALFSFASPVDAQSFRGWVGSTIQLVELRPLGLDTIPRASVQQRDGGTFFFGDRPVVCVEADLCTAYAPRPEVHALAATQDLNLTAWGLGVRGLSFTTLLRGRARMGSELLWPRTDDAFDAILGYAQLVRGRWRLRAGRQEIRSGLGFSAFDGGNVTLTHGDWRLEGYGGRSLARGLREPANEALRGLEDFLPDASVRLVGGSARAQFNETILTARYQREILADRSGLVSERASVDFSSATRRTRVTGSLDYDFAFDHVGKGHLTVSVPLAGTPWILEASARRYVPYFEMSTIWGFFQPVSYSEAEVRSTWSPGGALAAWFSGGWRHYQDAETSVILQPLTDDGWRANAGLRWQARDAWLLQGSYRLEWGPGGFLNSADVSARYHPSERVSVTASGTTFQHIEEFRLGDGRAYGGGLSFDFGVTGRANLSGGMSMIRHRDEGTLVGSPWNQARGWTSLRIEVGNDPGLAARRQP